MGSADERIQAACDGFMVGKFERSFVKDLSNSLKTFYNFATMLQNAWALHPLLLASFLSLEGCTSVLNVPFFIFKTCDFLRNYYSFYCEF